jgi:hypothetical protein
MRACQLPVQLFKQKKDILLQNSYQINITEVIYCNSYLYLVSNTNFYVHFKGIFLPSSCLMRQREQKITRQKPRYYYVPPQFACAEFTGNVRIH